MVEALSSENPFFSGKTQIQTQRTRDLWTQQYLRKLNSANRASREKHRDFAFSFENNERVNIKLF